MDTKSLLMIISIIALFVLSIVALVMLHYRQKRWVEEERARLVDELARIREYYENLPYQDIDELIARINQYDCK